MDRQTRIQAGRHPIRRIVAAGLILILLAVIGVNVSLRIHWSRRIDRQFSAMKTAGMPTTLAELNHWYRLPDGVADNAAGTYLDAFASYAEPNDEDADRLPMSGSNESLGREESLSDGTKAAMARLVAANKQALALLREAAEIPACRYPIDFRKRNSTEMHWLSMGMLRCVRLLSYEAILLAQHGEWEAAGRSIEYAVRVQDSLLAEPTMLSQSVRMNRLPPVLSSLEWVMSRGQLPPEVLVAVDRALAKADDPDATRRATVGSRLLTVDDIQCIRAGRLGPSNEGWCPGPIGLALYRAVGLADRDMAEYLEGSAAVIEGLTLPEHQRLSVLMAIERDRRKALTSNHVLFSDALLGGSGRCLFELSSLGRIRTTRTALAIERHRLKTGNLPVSLDALVPEHLAATLRDPFTGEPLKYGQLAKGYVVYSVGQDLSDDGGKERPAKGGGPFDVTFTVER